MDYNIIFRPQLINILEFLKSEARFVISIKNYPIYVSFSKIPELDQSWGTNPVVLQC